MPSNSRKRTVLHLASETKGCARVDKASKEIVDMGIKYLEKDGIKKASEFLQRSGISRSVALRTLLHPKKRRS